MDPHRLELLRKKAEQALRTLDAKGSEADGELASEFSIYQAELEAQHQELVEADLQIELQVQRLQTLFDETPVPFFIIDGKFALELWNDAALTLGLHGSLAQGAFFTKLFLSVERMQLPQWLQADEGSATELRVISAKDPRLHCSLIKKSLDCDQWLIIATDIVREQYQHNTFTEREQALTYFARELREPAAVLATLIDTDPRVADSARAEEFRLNAQHILDVLDDMGRITTQGIGAIPSIAPVEIGALVEETLARLAPVLNQAGLSSSLDRESLGDEPLWLQLDHRSVTSILTHLLNNAAQHAGGSRVTVKPHMQAHDGRYMLTLNVEDDGEGIAPEERKRLLKPNQQTPGRNPVGTGLSVSRLLAGLMQGSLHIGESALGGCSVTLALPVPAPVEPRKPSSATA